MNFLIDTHTHTIASGHAYSTIEENAKSAFNNGIKLLAITEHAPKIQGAPNEIYFANFRAIPRKIHNVDILMGVELNILDFNGAVDLNENYLQHMDIVIASLHPPCIDAGTKLENTSAMISAMQNQYIDIIGHPGDPRYEIDIEEIVEASKETKCLLEINNSSLNPNGFRTGSKEYMTKILKLCEKKDVPVIIGSDAHFSTQVGVFNYAEDLIKETLFPEELILNTSIERFRKYFRV